MSGREVADLRARAERVIAGNQSGSYKKCDMARDILALLDERAEIGAALHATSYGDEWRVGREPRSRDDVALKSGIYTVLTVGSYYDGGSDEQAEALTAIVAAVNLCLAAVLRPPTPEGGET